MSSVLTGSRFLTLLQQNLKTLIQAKQIHAQLVTNGCQDNSLYGKLLGRYCSKLSSEGLKLANLLVFPRFDHPDKFLFNTLLKCSKPEDSIGIFAKWATKNVLLLHERTFIFVFGACARSASSGSVLWFGRQVHGMGTKRGFLYRSELIGTTLIHFYAKNRDLCSARKVFDEMPKRTSVTWNAMIGGYCSQKDKENHYARTALTLFQTFYSCNDNGVKPTDTTMVCILSAISQTGFLELGSLIHGYIQKLGFTPEIDVFIGTALVDMYSKCGCLNSAFSVFNLMTVKNVLTWTSMATGLALNGKGHETPNLLHQMAKSGIKPNEVTFTSLLSAYRHIGLVQEGLELFQTMKSRFGITPVIQHYGCVVDLLSKAGRLQEAYEFVLAMPIKPDAILLRNLCNACSIHGETTMGEEIGKVLLKKWSDSDVECEDYIALSNLLASKGKWAEVELLREEMKDRKIKTRPGYSLL